MSGGTRRGRASRAFYGRWIVGAGFSVEALIGALMFHSYGAYVVHEMLHLTAPTHSEQFLTLMRRYYPSWREARAELNELPLAAESWRL